MTFVADGDKIRGIKGKNTKGMKFREEKGMDAETWYKKSHCKKMTAAIDKIKFRK